MVRYIAQRLWLMIPTVIAVLVIAFLLLQSAPGDVVGRQLGLDGDITYVSRQVYKDSYYQKAVSLGALSPSFYFTITPAYFPANINNIYPYQNKVNRRNLLREIQDWDQVHQLYNNIESTIIQLEKDGDQSGTLPQLLQLEQSNSLAELKYKSARFSTADELDNAITADITSIISSISQLESSRSLSYPVLRWHGMDNQFHHWMAQLFSPAEHISLVDGRSVWSKIINGLKWTFSMSLISLLCIGVLSLITAYTQVRYLGGWWDKVSSIIMYVLYTMPLFWLCTMMIVFFTTAEYGSWADIFPSVGIRPSFNDDGFLSIFWRSLGQLVLPIVCIVLHSMAYLTRQTKSNMIEGLDKPYSLTAAAKGLSKSQIIRQHVLPDALLPFTTLMTGAIPALFTGSIIVEVIFNIPGIGRLMLESVNNGDWPVILTILIVISIATIVGYLIGDIILVKLYPKTASNITNSTATL